MPRKTKTVFEHSPHLKDEWDYEKNVDLDPETLTHGSTVYAWWKCSNDHSWQMRIHYRLRGGRCLSCVPRKSVFNMDVNTPLGCYSLASTHPDLVSEWDDERYSPENISRSFSKSVNWKCNLGHQWVAPVNTRASSKTKCPYCAKQGRHKRVLAGFNDLQSLDPELGSELYDEGYASTEVLQFSNKQLRWKCKNSHLYFASPMQRSFGRSCPDCPELPNYVSSIENRLKDLVASEKNFRLKKSQKVDVAWRSFSSMRVDIHGSFSGIHKIAIEYDGQYWHQDSLERDTEKTQELLNAGYYVVRVRENNLAHLTLENPNLLQLTVKYSSSDKNLMKAVGDIELWLLERTK